MTVWGLDEEYRQWHRMSDEQLEVYYAAKYNGKTWSQLGVLDPSFRGTLKKRGLKHLVPDPDERRDWTSMSDGDVMAYLSGTYPKAFREDIRGLDSSLYNQLRVRGLLERVPYRNNKPRPQKPKAAKPGNKAPKPASKEPSPRPKAGKACTKKADRFETEEYKSEILQRIAALKRNTDRT